MQAKSLNGNQVFYFYVLIWSIFGAVQARCTGLHPDEAYYHQFSQTLDWGYFDHPPMIALLIRAGGFFFDGITGLRFGTVLLNPLFWMLVWRLVRTEQSPGSRQAHIMGILMASLPMMQLYGFITTPDMPLLGFTALFWLVYRRILVQRGSEWSNAAWLCFALTGMAYSKYLGAIQVVLALAAHPKLMRNRTWIIASTATLILLIPHFFWQYRHDFVTFRFHLGHRTEGIHWDYIWQYLPNQLAVFHPFNLLALFMLDWRPTTPSDPMKHAMRLSLLGMMIFYGLLSLRGHTEPHWTVSATIPMLWLFVRQAEEHEHFRRFILRFTGPSLLVVFALRLWLFTDSGNRVARLSRPDPLYTAMADMIDDRPALFSGSFQDAALFQFHTGKTTGLVHTDGVRGTQYDLWKRHAQWQHHPVVVFGAEGPRAQWLSVGDRGISYIESDHLQSPELLHIQQISKHSTHHPDSLLLVAWVTNPTDYVMDQQQPDFPFSWVLYNSKPGTGSIDTLQARNMPTSGRFESRKTTPISWSIHKEDLPVGPITVGLKTIFGRQFPSQPAKKQPQETPNF